MESLQRFKVFLKSITSNQIKNAVLAIVIAIIFWLLSSIISYGIVKLFYRNEEKTVLKNGSLYKAIRAFLRMFGIFTSSKILELNAEQNAFCDRCFKVVIIWTIARIVSGIFEARIIILEKINKNLANKKSAFMTSVTSTIVKIIVYIIASYLSLKEFGYDIGGITTGLGLTGAVVALAAQDIVKQVFSGIMIFIDKPFEIGDWVEIENIEGTVEDISIKSTKIRTIEDTIVTVPNNTMTEANVINWGRIGKRVYRANLKLSLETEERTVEKVLNRIRFILKYNEDIIKKSMNIQFDKIEEDSLNIYIYIETTITSYKEYQAFCNKINLTILNILETVGVKLAYPGKNIYIKEESKEKIDTKKNKKDI